MSSTGLRLLDAARRKHWPDLLAAGMPHGPRRGEDAWLFWLRGATAGALRLAETELAGVGRVAHVTRDVLAPAEVRSAPVVGAVETNMNAAEQAVAVLERAAEMNWPEMSESAWRIAVTMPDAHTLPSRLDRVEAERRADADFAERSRLNRVAAGLEAPSAAEQERAAQHRIEAAAAQREWDAGRLGRIEEHLATIAAAVSKR